jgi:hypothetical protein
MSGFPATCDKCGYKLKGVEETCPNCGPAPKTVHLEATAHVTSSVSVSMTIDRLREEIEKNWLWIVVTLAFDVASILGAFFLSGIPSVVATMAAILITTVTGYRAVTKVRTIVRETR